MKHEQASPLLLHLDLAPTPQISLATANSAVVLVVSTAVVLAPTTWTLHLQIEYEGQKDHCDHHPDVAALGCFGSLDARKVIVPCAVQVPDLALVACPNKDGSAAAALF